MDKSHGNSVKAIKTNIEACLEQALYYLNDNPHFQAAVLLMSKGQSINGGPVVREKWGMARVTCADQSKRVPVQGPC